MGMFKGKIHWFDSRKKYGYVIDGYGNEYYFNKSGVIKARKIVIETFEGDDEVEFDLIEDGPKGKYATNVKLVAEAAPAKKDKKPFKKKDNNEGSAMKDALVKAGLAPAEDTTVSTAEETSSEE